MLRVKKKLKEEKKKKKKKKKKILIRYSIYQLSDTIPKNELPEAILLSQVIDHLVVPWN